MIKHLIVSIILFFSSATPLFAAEVLVKTDSISYSGYSAISSDKSVIYGGIAGSACRTTGGIATCNSCTDVASSGVNACNQKSVYADLTFSVSFQVTKTVTGVAKLFVESSSGVFDAVTTLASASYTKDSTTVTLTTTWSAICSRMGLSNTCTGASPQVISKSIRFGVDSDNSGEVDDTERKAVTVKLHYIPGGAPADVTQSYCPATGAGAGVCNLTFLVGDNKAFIDTAIYNGDDVSATSTGGTIPWESIAIFPVRVTAGGESNAYTTFANGVAQPIFKTINPSDGSIPDSMVTGGIENYNEYCMVYGTRNAAQNIYKFVITGIDTTKSCVTPSEVVGILDDKHCFISTAAFGSKSAIEVDVFRKFRNKFLVNNIFGRAIVKFYYKISPPIAEVISQNGYLRFLTQTLLYPIYIFSLLSLKLGLIWSTVIFFFVTFLMVKFSRYVHSKKIMLVLFMVLISQNSKAEVVPKEVKINHPQAAEGLVRIQKDGTYIYNIERTLKNESSRISLGTAYHPEITISIEKRDSNGNPTGVVGEYTFEDFYNESSGFILGYDYDWFPFDRMKRFGIQAGASLMSVTGSGRLVTNPNTQSVESFTFATIPLNLGGTFRFEWKDKQLFAPYISGGGTYVVLLEKREDKSFPNLAGGLGFYGAGGVLLNLGLFDSDSSFNLESEYGIGNMWLSVEFRAIEVSSDAFTFSNRYVNAGLSFDF